MLVYWLDCKGLYEGEKITESQASRSTIVSLCDSPLSVSVASSVSVDENTSATEGCIRVCL